jgi:hypothetical protein
MADKDFQVKNGIIVGGDAFISNSITSVNTISFQTSGYSGGNLSWNTSDGTLDLETGYGDVVLQLGQETHYIIRNDTGSSILNGTSLYASGVTDGSARIEASPYVANNSIDSIRYLGLATQDISSGVNGVVTHFGYVRDLDTRGTSNSAMSVGDEDWSVGDVLWAHPSAPGKLTNQRPAAPNNTISVAIVISRHQTAGVVFVRPNWQPKLVELQDVAVLDGIADGESLVWVSANSRFENQTVSGGAGDEANLYNTYTTLTANDYSTYTTLTANIYNTFEYLNANISTGTANLVSDQYIVTTSNIFTLTQSVVDANNILVSMDGIIQSPNDDYVVSGTTLNINNTVPIPSGTEVEIRHINRASVTSGGAASATWSIISSNTVLAANTNYFVDISLQPITVTLPSSPTTGQTIRLIDMAGLAEANNITVTSVADKILRVNDNLVVSSNSAAFTLIYSNTDYGWLLGEL